MTRQQQEDLFITALEGGSNYWYDIKGSIDLSKHYNKSLSFSERLFRAIMDDGLEVIITDIETDEELGKVNKLTITKGSYQFMEEFGAEYNDLCEDNWDANTADLWFQLVVMQEIVYG